ncbi:histidine kinase [Shewanella mangrovi]|uniref:Histidine kinase n=1 Tax=Shewanella mangrovi TaxID=1515746 RepID=A0A094LSL7_9GAMM|nr:flagellar motor protein MotB [Shewanella mangrovi]KFZ38183.1 histidine kinase [Shewanella mangrovi]
MSINNDSVIVRRQNRRNEAPKHTGAWKVAFADFTLAMMSFFMVMWLMQVSSKDERVQTAHYMRTHSIFDGSPSFFDPENSPYPIDLGGTPSIIDHEAANRLPPDNPLPGMSEYLSVPQGKKDSALGRGDKLNSLIEGTAATPAELSALLQNFQQIAKQQLAEGNVLVEAVPSGLRVIIKDDKNHQMFPRGQEEMTPFFEDLLFCLGEVFKQIKNSVIISGHTDVTGYNNSNYSNWELSASRALKARQMLVAGGMPANRVEQVNGFGSTRLLNQQDQASSENRRVELLILTPKAEQQLNALFATKTVEETAPAVQQAAKDAQANQPVTRLSEMQQ